MGYVFLVAVLVTGGVILFAVTHSRRENRLVPRPTLVGARRTLQQSRHVVVSGDQCVCGGILGLSGRVSDKFGPLIGCTGCTRFWTASGHRIRTRPVRRPSPRPGAPVGQGPAGPVSQTPPDEPPGF